MFKYIRNILPEKKSRTWFWIVMIILLSFYPYKLANAYYPFIQSNIETIFIMTIILVAIVFDNQKTWHMPKPLNRIVWIMVIGCIFSFILTGHKFYYHKLIIMFGGVALILLVDYNVGFRRFYQLYNRWILVMAALGVVGFIIALAGVPPINIFSASEDSRPVSSWIVTFSKQQFPGAGFMRYAGFFDEPGAMGYWGVFALAINRLFIHDVKLERWLIICLLFTFSMGYYSQLLIFIILTVLGRNEGPWRKALWITICIAALVVINTTKGTEYEMIYEESVGRFEQASKGEELMEGTSREKLTKLSKKIFLENPWIGIGWPEKNKQYIGDNPYETLAHDGIIGSLYLYFPFLLLLYWSFKYRDYQLFSMIIFIASGFMHRPFHFNFLTFFIFYSIPIMYYREILERRQMKLEMIAQKRYKPLSNA